MVNFLYGVFGVVLCLGLCAAGFFLGYKFGAALLQRSSGEPKSAAQELDETEREAVRRERDELRRDQQAFRQLMSYSADMAYGRVSPEDAARSD